MIPGFEDFFIEQKCSRFYLAHAIVYALIFIIELIAFFSNGQGLIFPVYFLTYSLMSFSDFFSVKIEEGPLAFLSTKNRTYYIIAAIASALPLIGVIGSIFFDFSFSSTEGVNITKGLFIGYIMGAAIYVVVYLIMNFRNSYFKDLLREFMFYFIEPAVLSVIILIAALSFSGGRGNDEKIVIDFSLYFFLLVISCIVMIILNFVKLRGIFHEDSRGRSIYEVFAGKGRKSKMTLDKTDIPDRPVQIHAASGSDRKLHTVGSDMPDKIERSTRNASEKGAETVPALLRYPYDPIAEKMFEGHMKVFRDIRCGYAFKTYTPVADGVSETIEQQPPYDVNVTQIFSKENTQAWYAVSTMIGEPVRISNIRNWVEIAFAFGTAGDALNRPSGKKDMEYSQIEFKYLGTFPEYADLHSFDEAHVYTHIFTLGDTICKQFILLAKQENRSWKVEVTIPSSHRQIIPLDMTPPSLIFGSFFPE